MAKINLSESTGGQFINEAGEKVLLKITKCEYDQEYGKVEMVLENEKGETVNNNFGLIANDGTNNEPALKAFSYFTRVAMGDWGATEIEDEDLIGKWIRADIKIVKGSNPGKDGKPVHFANIDKCYMITDEDVDYIADNAKEDKPKASTKAKTAGSSMSSKNLPFGGADDEEWD